MTDIVARLRDGANPDKNFFPYKAWGEAADEIERLRAQLTESREALQPFAALAAELEYEGSKWRDHETQWMQTFDFKLEPTVGDLRRARAVYEKIKGAGDE
jgi:hypothetical protein